MKVEELKASAIFQVLKKDKKAQQAVSKLGRSEEWIELKQFVAKVKQVLLEATLDVDDFEQIRKYKFLIRGMESVVLLPGLVGLVKDVAKQDKLDKDEKAKEKERMKYNPGAFVRRTIEKVKNVKLQKKA